MKFIGYGLLTLLSLGILGAIISIGAFAWVINHYGDDLPDYKQLKTYEPDVVTRVYTGDGQLMAEFATEKRIFVPIEFIPDLVKEAFISAEDKSFYSHNGLDYIGIVRAMINNLKNPSNLQGASTITQQVAKNFLLTNERSYERKVKEAILAIRMERAMSKDRLLELYLNQIYLGIGTYGVAAASQQYFNKSLDDLTIEEAAFLAALPKAPNNYHPVRKKERAIARRNWVIGRMEIDGKITAEQAEAARAKDLDVVELSAFTQSYRAPYFGEEIRRFLKDQFQSDGLYKEGLIVRSSLDPKLQDIAVRAFRDGLTAYDIRQGYRGAVATLDNFDDWKTKLANIEPQKGMAPDWELALYFGDREIRFEDGSTAKITQAGLNWAGDKIQKGSVIMVAPDDDEEGVYRIRQVPEVEGGFVVMSPHTGRVLAMQGGWDYQNSEFNRVTQARRQPGSAFKPFIYLSALEDGMTPATIVMDAPVSFSQGPGLPLWRPQNYSDKFYGPTSLRVGVEKSRNVMTVRLADKVGMEKVADVAKRFQIYDDMPQHLANSLGSQETTLIRMATAYGMLVNGGKTIQPSFIDRIQDRYGKTIFDNDNRDCINCGPKLKWHPSLPVPVVADTRGEATSPQRAYQMISILEGVVQRGTAVRLRELPFPIAGKTGTTNDSKDAWFMGVTPDLVIGVYVGFDKPRSLGPKETGSSVAIPIVKQFLEDAYEKGLINPVPFRVPPEISMIQVNAKTGRRAYPGDAHVIWEAFLRGESPDNQQTVFGGETVIFEEPDIDYADLFSDIPLNQGAEPYMPFDPNAQTAPQIPAPSPQFQGTGEIY
jgi:penicillin-binding protein 1A